METVYGSVEYAYLSLDLVVITILLCLAMTWAMERISGDERHRYVNYELWKYNELWIMNYARVMLYVYGGYFFVTLLSYSISSGARGSPDLLLSYSIIALALHNTIILIISHLSIPTPKQINKSTINNQQSTINWNNQQSTINWYRYQQSVGYSCVLFAWIIAASVRMDEFCPIIFFPDMCFPTYTVPLLQFPVNLGPLVLLVITKVVIPQSSFMGHLSGVCEYVHLCICRGYIVCLELWL